MPGTGHSNRNSSDEPVVITDPSLYEDAQVLLAVGIVRKAWGYFFVGAVIVLSFLVWTGNDLDNTREEINKLKGELNDETRFAKQEIKDLKKELKHEANTAIKDIEHLSKTFEQEINVVREEASKIVSQANQAVSNAENQLESQSNQQDFLKDRLEYLNDQIQIVTSLPKEYSELLVSQSKEFGTLSTQNQHQLDDVQEILGNISSQSEDLIRDSSNVASSLKELEGIRGELNERLKSLENRVFHRWDEVIRTKDNNKVIPNLGLKLDFDTEHKDLSMRNVELWDDVLMNFFVLSLHFSIENL